MSEGALPKDRFETIEAFLMGTMEPDARQRFQQELAADAQLHAEMELQRDNTLAVELAGLTRTLQSISAEHREEVAATAGRPWTTYLKYAAMVALLAIGAVWWLARPPESERVYAEYYVQDPGLPVPMSAVKDPVFQDAMVAYKLGEFAEARSKWGGLLQAEPNNDTLRFYIANTYLAQGDAKAAIPLFQNIAEVPGSAFHNNARWYLFLALLHEGRLNELPDSTLVQDPVYGARVSAIRAKLHP